MPSERPPIAEEHRLFHSNIVSICQTMGEYVLQRATEDYSMPAFEGMDELLGWTCVESMSFVTPKDEDDVYYGSFVGNRSIRGGSSFYIDRVENTEEVNEVPDLADTWRQANTFGKTIHLTINYDAPRQKPAQPWEGILYTATDIPPIIIAEEAIHNERYSSLAVLNLLDRSIPPEAVHYPNERELRDIRQGLRAATADINMISIFTYCYDSYSQNMKASDALARQAWLERVKWRVMDS